jgi:hypothetical protein
VATDAAKALRKLQANIQVGVGFEEYDQLVTEANVTVSEASAVLQDGELKQELNAAIDAYRDVRSIWVYQRSHGTELRQDDALGQRLISKYSLKTTKAFSDRADPSINPPYADVDEARIEMWDVARKHLERVNVLLRE